MKGCVLLSILSRSYAVKVAKVSSRQEALASFSEKVFDPNSEHPDISHAMHKIAEHVDLASAFESVRHKDLPPTVAHLVQSASEGQKTVFDEESMRKARKALNNMVEKAWLELDEKIIECKEWEELNRWDTEEVIRDRTRVESQIADLERIQSESNNGKGQAEKDIRDTEDELEEKTKEYQEEYNLNHHQLTLHQNDLDVFQFILEFTKCEAASTSLLQTSYQVCLTNSDQRTLLFKDPGTAKKFNELLRPGSRQQVDSLLASLHSTSDQAPSFLQVTEPVGDLPPEYGNDGVPISPCVNGAPNECVKSCIPDAVPDCGLLHDRLSLMWGEFKDNVDELTMEMAKNAETFNELKTNLNAQIDLLADKKGKLIKGLAEVSSDLSSDRAEHQQIVEKKRILDEKHHEFMAKCKKRIEWIMYQDMCALKVVRNAVLESSEECSPDKIVDCDVDAWVNQDCSVSCDDNCKHTKLDDDNCVGGRRELTRDKIIPANSCGIACPTLTESMRCGRHPCPVDCKMSDWSGWSHCSAECEGGVQSRTRSTNILSQYGGEACSNAEDTRSCNTGSCDRDCTLVSWTKWSPCSVACGEGGLQERQRHVLVPIRGNGKCPKSDNHQRFEKRQCNTQRCVGDEICVANLDLVVAIDGSGSLTEKGWETLKNYAKTVVSRFQSKYNGRKRVNIGIVQFGNGYIMSDGKTVSPAVNALAMTPDKSAWLNAVKGLEFKKGFTNMAQAFGLANSMFAQKSRKGAQHAVLVITDGKPSFSFETDSMVTALEDKGIMRQFVVINDVNADLTRVKKWTSPPWETNFVHVPGLDQIQSDNHLWVQKALTKFCPRAFSPSRREKRERTNKYQLVYSQGWCNAVGGWHAWGWKAGPYKRVLKICRNKAKKKGHSIFTINPPPVYGDASSKGWFCWTAKHEVTPAQYNAWSEDKTNPECPGGSWVYSPNEDFYVLKPKDPQSCSAMGINVPDVHECTHRSIWHWTASVPTPNFDEAAWTSETAEQFAGADACVMFASTDGRTCKQFCAEEHQKVCVRGSPAADRTQTNNLEYWLEGLGKAGTWCSAGDEAFQQQTADENGCLQEWDEQICACK